MAQASVARGRASRIGEYVRLLRPSQWTKNLLVLIPLVLSHQLSNLDKWQSGLLAMAAFCATASAGYILNDLLDRQADRLHPRKQYRPLAAATVSVNGAIALGVALLAAGAWLASWLPAHFGWTLGAYLGLAIAYTLALKRIPILDAVTLGGLYDIRVFAGGAAMAIIITPPTLAFLLFLCFSVALAKRCSELQQCEGLAHEGPERRGYLYRDSGSLLTMGTSSGYLSVMVLALYVSSAEAQRLYHRPELLWLLCPLLLYWISRIWLLVGRKELEDDPIAFALTDRATYLCGLVGGFVLWLSS